MKFAIVAVGTEITAGEVVNSNASWLSERIEGLGYTVTHHMAVPDDKALMSDAFNYLHEKVDVVVTTGGLGPTSDDFTSEVVSQWLGRRFDFNNVVWQALQKQHTARGLKIIDAHKTQCFFPQGATIFENPVGSACGFFSSNQNKNALVLPGPPREIEGMWLQSVADFLRNKFPKGEKKILKKWTCLGVTESEVADQVETLFEGSGVDLGYRASTPYVQVKAWFTNQCQSDQWCPQVEKLLNNKIVARDGDDPIQLWIDELPQGKKSIFDSVTQGYLTSRLWEKAMSAHFDVISTAQMSPTQNVTDDEVIFELTLLSDSKTVVARVRKGNQIQQQELIYPYKFSLQNFQAQKFFTEMAFQVWHKLISAN